MTLKKKPFENVGEGENAGNQHFLLIPQSFLPIPKRISIIKLLISMPANAFSLDQSRYLFFVKELTLSKTSPSFFLCLQYKSFENTIGKGEIVRNKQFLLIPQCFLPVWITFCQFHQA